MCLFYGTWPKAMELKSQQIGNIPIFARFLFKLWRRLRFLAKQNFLKEVARKWKRPTHVIGALGMVTHMKNVHTCGESNWTHVQPNTGLGMASTSLKDFVVLPSNKVLFQHEINIPWISFTKEHGFASNRRLRSLFSPRLFRRAV